MPSIPEPESPEEFEFSGWLSFYPFKSDVKEDLAEATSQTNVEQTLDRKLPEYKQGRPSAPGDGFEIANTSDLFRESHLLNEYPFLDEIVHIKYLQEEFQKRLAYEEHVDDFVETSTVEISTSDVFWVYPQYLFSRASKEESYHIQSRMRSILVNSFRIKKVEFKYDFFIWLIYKNYIGESIGNEVRLEQLQSIEFAGEADIFGSQNQISDFQSISAAVLVPLLNEKKPESIKATFGYRGHNIVSSISHNKIQIFASKGSLVELSDLEKMALALSFVSKFTNLYDRWAMLSKKEQYPPLSFFKEIYRQAIEEDYKIQGISQALIEKYQQVREDK